MGVGAGLYMCDVVKKFTFAISSPDEFLFVNSPAMEHRSVWYRHSCQLSGVAWPSCLVRSDWHLLILHEATRRTYTFNRPYACIGHAQRVVIGEGWLSYKSLTDFRVCYSQTLYWITRRRSSCMFEATTYTSICISTVGSRWPSPSDIQVSLCHSMNI